MVNGGLSDASAIWEKFRDDFCEGLTYTIAQNRLICDPTIDRPDVDYGLFLIHKELLKEEVDHVLGPLAKYHLPGFQNNWETHQQSSPLTRHEPDYDRRPLAERAAIRETQLNDDQRNAYTHILRSLRDDPESACFFLNGPGGTGRTFLYNTLCHQLRSEGKIVLCVASTGIAAQLLPGGRTAHKRFKIRIPITDTSTCKITWGSQTAELLRAAHLLIWDETPMTHRHVFDAVERTLQDIRRTSHDGDNDKPFGGLPVIFGGNFQQILPVVPHAGCKEIVAASLQHSVIWLALTKNMRLQDPTPENVAFGKWLAEMSHDPSRIGCILIPPMVSRSVDFEKFVERIYPAAGLQESSQIPTSSTVAPY